jgi:hypothetical protein
MKTFHIVIAIIVFGFLFIGCSDSPVSPADQTVSLNKKGPVIHRVQGSLLLSLDEKNLGGRFTAHQYSDGSYDGDYEVNGANALGDPSFKWNGDILFLKVWENIGQYNGTMGVMGGVEKTGPYSGWYDVIFVIDNGLPGQSSAPDEGINVIWMTQNLTEAEGWWNMDPYDLIEMCFGSLPAERGNVTVE